MSDDFEEYLLRKVLRRGKFKSDKDKKDYGGVIRVKKKEEVLKRIHPKIEGVIKSKIWNLKRSKQADKMFKSTGFQNIDEKRGSMPIKILFKLIKNQKIVNNFLKGVKNTSFAKKYSEALEENIKSLEYKYHKNTPKGYISSSLIVFEIEKFRSVLNRISTSEKLMEKLEQQERTDIKTLIDKAKDQMVQEIGAINTLEEKDNLLENFKID